MSDRDNGTYLPVPLHPLEPERRLYLLQAVQEWLDKGGEIGDFLVAQNCTTKEAQFVTDIVRKIPTVFKIEDRHGGKCSVVHTSVCIPTPTGVVTTGLSVEFRLNASTTTWRSAIAFRHAKLDTDPERDVCRLVLYSYDDRPREFHLSGYRLQSREMPGGIAYDMDLHVESFHVLHRLFMLRQVR